MDSALVIGGTRFIGPHVVEELRSAGYDVTIFNRGRSPNPFADDPAVDHVEGDRTDEDRVREVAAERDPDLVVDCVAYHPGDVRVATEAFADVDAYVYVSSGSAYAEPEIPMREDETPLEPCTDEQAADDSPESYGARKAEGDRTVFEAADRDVNATSVRPMLVYGPRDHSGRFPYWVEQVASRERVVVPWDGDSLLHRSYVGDVAGAIRIVAEEGDPGEAYNVADRQLLSLAGTVERLADALETEVEVVRAGGRELDEQDLSAEDFPLYTSRPFVADTEKLAALGWESTPLDEALARTVEDHVEADRTDPEVGPDPGRLDAVLAST